MTTTPSTRLNDVDIAAVAGLAGKIQDDPDTAATTWSARVDWTGGFRSEASIRDFAPFRSDEPAALGGTDGAPNPVEQLLAALGNCLAVGYAANASALGVHLDGVRIDLEGELDLHTFLGLDPHGNAGFETIRAAVHIDSPASAEELAQLHAQVTATSPVGHTLQRPVPVAIDLV